MLNDLKFNRILLLLLNNYIKIPKILTFDPIETVIISVQYTILLKILVTGGAGFIGRFLVKFLQTDHKVAIYDDLSNSSKSDVDALGDGVLFVKGDVLNFEELKKSTVGYDLVIHLAAKSAVSESILNPERTHDVNVNGTENIVKCCLENKIKKLIFASSAAVYADSRTPLKETSNTCPQSPYGKSKLEAEEIVKKYSKKFGLDSIILRMFNVYGKGQNLQYAGVISKFISAVSENKPIQINGDGKQTRDFVSVFDIVDAFDCSIKKIVGKRGAHYNIASGISVSINQLAEMFQTLNKKTKVIHTNQNPNEIMYSTADVTMAKNELSFVAKRKLKEELQNLF